MSRISPERERWLDRLERDRNRAIDSAIKTLESVRKKGDRAEVRIEISARHHRVSGSTGPVDVLRFEDQADFYCEVPEGPESA